jgi:hypothetical protein
MLYISRSPAPFFFWIIRSIILYLRALSKNGAKKKNLIFFIYLLEMVLNYV